jgi:phosphoribosylformimino-5-aminoimidazole carboxamide ribotide isomerase
MSLGGRNQLHLLPRKENRIVDGSLTFTLMVDAGIRDQGDVAKVIKSGADQIIIGTETLISLEILQELTKQIDTCRLMVSIDVEGNQVRSPNQEIASLSPDQAIKVMAKKGIRTFILLQISRVGTETGLDKELILKCLVACQEASLPGHLPVALILGGGVSGYTDLEWLVDHGVAGVLVASVLHKGLLGKEMIRKLKERNNRWK